MRPLANHKHRFVYFLFVVGDVASVGALYLPYSSLPKLATSNGHDSEILIALLGLGSFLGCITAGGLCSSSKVKPNFNGNVDKRNLPKKFKPLPYIFMEIMNNLF